MTTEVDPMKLAQSLRNIADSIETGNLDPEKVETEEIAYLNTSKRLHTFSVKLSGDPEYFQEIRYSDGGNDET